MNDNDKVYVECVIRRVEIHVIRRLRTGKNDNDGGSCVLRAGVYALYAVRRDVWRWPPASGP